MFKSIRNFIFGDPNEEIISRLWTPFLHREIDEKVFKKYIDIINEAGCRYVTHMQFNSWRYPGINKYNMMFIVVGPRCKVKQLGRVI